MSRRRAILIAMCFILASGLPAAAAPNAPGTPGPLMRVARGEVTNDRLIVMRGHNPGIGSMDGFVDISEFGNLAYLDNGDAQVMEIVSTNDEDGGAGTDTGLLTLQILGVDNDGEALEETVTLNGITPVLTVGSYLRVNSMVGLAVGSGGWNLGDITATAITALTIQDQMAATDSVSQSSHFTVPVGRNLFILQCEGRVGRKVGQQQPIIEVKSLVRQGGAGNAWLPLSDTFELSTTIPQSIIERSDIRTTGLTDTMATEFRSRCYGVLVRTDE